jgi:transglutaminase-like putative cysteine protease
MESISSLKAQVILPNGSIARLSKEDFFEEKINDDWVQIKFSCPKLVEGAVIEYKYVKTRETIFNLGGWYFQTDIPTRQSEYVVQMPEFFQYVTYTQGRRVNSYEKKGGATPTYNYTNHILTMKDVPSMKEEAYITTMNDYRSKVQFQISRILPEHAPPIPILTSWGELAETLDQSSTFGGLWKRKGPARSAMDEIDEAMSTRTTEEEKVNAIYSYINQNYKVLDYHSYSLTQPSMWDLIDKKAGSAGELNLLMLALLNNYGIEAHPVLISTRSHGKMLEAYPILSQFNHVLVFIPGQDGKFTILDAGNPLRPPGYPAVESLNRKGLLLLNNNPQWIEIDSKKSKRSMLAQLQLLENGELSGSISASGTGYIAVSDREERYREKTVSGWNERLRRFSESAVNGEIQMKNETIINKSISARFDCTLDEAVQEANDILYVSPFIYSLFTENPFELEVRDYPVDIPYPMKEHYVLNLDIPADYQVDELPEPVNLVLPDHTGSLKYMVSQTGDKIQINSQFELSETFFPPEQYGSLKSFFDIYIEKQNEMIVLIKKED